MGDDTIFEQETLNNRLKQAMYSHDYAKARLFLARGADPNTINTWGSPLIYWCAEKGKIDLIDLALEKGADINAANKSGETALHRAAYVGRVDVIDHLINKGANLNQKNMYDATPLFIAVRHDQLESVQMLLSKGADPSIRNHEGVSAAENAKKMGYHAIEAVLAGHG